MKILIKAKPGASQTEIKKTGHLSYSVSVKEPAVNGRANQAIAKVLANYFQVSISRINIIKGRRSRNKIVEIKD
ncbi:MAG TPA: DUF167 domain-containing protein [Candidatus Pacearchaeota archaeon]|nr:DUF167 domain-containing protein [Candidatus Pacearchaeota archaeon]